MLKKLEGFLNTKYYLIVTFSLFFLIWSYKFFIPNQVTLIQTIFISFVIISLLGFVVFAFFENTVYTIPLFIGILFSIGVENMNLETIEQMTFGVIAGVIIVAGIITHLIRFKVKPKLNYLGIGMLLAVVSFYIPLLYTNFNHPPQSASSNFLNALMISSLAVIFFMIYIFYSNTLKKNAIPYLFRILLFAGLLLSCQLGALFIENLIIFNGSVKEGIKNLLRDQGAYHVGWGNVNDLTIQIVLMSASILYYMLKYPKKLWPWLLQAFYFAIIMLSFSKGSMVTVTLYTVILVVIACFRKDKTSLKNALIVGLIGIFILLIFKDFTYTLLKTFLTSLKRPINDTLTGRPEIWASARAVFNQSWVTRTFGAGWLTFTKFFEGQNRITVYHSTFYQVLATGGILGILILLFQFYQIGRLFKHAKAVHAKYAILLTYIITQLHGLVDNTQYMITYGIVTTIMFAVIETSVSKPSEISTKHTLLSNV